MVKICSVNEYPESNLSKYQTHFDKFNYPLHIFQKWAIEGIVEGNHVLITAPTGSGKSLPAEFALDYFHSIGKKTIYCSPIKSLSNQKFNDFTQKYPHIKIGIVTGDISCNPDADVIVMTTEILLNKLYQLNHISSNSSNTSFQMDIEHELGCVIFDEIHFISNEERGTVWENSIMLLPRHIQMVGLSATLDKPEQFAEWLENRGATNRTTNKIVYLTSKTIRAVPLIHYSFIAVNQSIFKIIKDKAIQEDIKKNINVPFVLQNEKNKFSDEQFHKTQSLLQLFNNKEVSVKRSHVLNQATKFLTENEMTPAICYVFSIKQIEICSKEITTNLLEFDSKIPYIAKRECDKILRDKFPNYEEYLHLPEYINLVSLLEKGIAIHHSKMLPVLREIVEIFFTRGYIKLLFATESVSIGLNLPVKTCLFTDIYKHDSSSLRILQGHEYTQAAGRAGRLGLDKVGHVIHLNNLFRKTDLVSYKNMMNGKSQSLSSKFKMSYNIILNLLDVGNTDFNSFTRQSMITCNLEDKLKDTAFKMDKATNELSVLFTSIKTPKETLYLYDELQKQLLVSVNKKRKEIQSKINFIKETCPTIVADASKFSLIVDKETEINNLKFNHDTTSRYLMHRINNVLDLLLAENFISGNLTDHTSLNINPLGHIACHFREVHCLAFTRLYEEKWFDKLTPVQLVSLFSCFTNVKVMDDYKSNTPKSCDPTTNDIIVQLHKMYQEYMDYELKHDIDTGYDYEMHYDLLEYVEKWCACDNQNDCKLVIQSLYEEKQIFLGEFVKSLLKINNIACELEKIAEMTGNILLLNKLKEIPLLTLKYVATNQSLYV